MLFIFPSFCTLLQITFAHQCLERRAVYNPIKFVYACMPRGLLPLESDILAQNDVGEFSSLLLDRLGELFPCGARGMAGSVVQHDGEDVFTRLLGGKTSQQIIGRGTCSHTRETAQSFMCLTLDITDLATPTIESSLAAFVKGVALEGDNAYFCDICGHKVDALKRTALAELPDSLMIALKRFDMDFTTFEVRAIYGIAVWVYDDMLLHFFIF